MKQNILIVGVGGQGNLFASAILAKSAIMRGFKVLSTETIGAAQRGGSVVSHLRISDEKVFSPLIPDGQADCLVGFEPIELLRNIQKLHPNGIYILNTYPIYTVDCNMGLDYYPSLAEINDTLNKFKMQGYNIEATEAAGEIGDPLLMNMVMVGALCAVSPFFDLDEIKTIVSQDSRRVFVEPNMKALDIGSILVGKSMEERLVRS
jgi:indolepyruvate ferredoxin oxidoreductase, beta subunit